MYSSLICDRCEVMTISSVYKLSICLHLSHQDSIVSHNDEIYYLIKFLIRKLL